jgi:orotidine-5'-phosphate decarboxylase
MNRRQLIQNIKTKKSFLCVGLDTDLDKIPLHLHTTEDPIFEFNKQIIDTTAPYTIAYKPNLAFYEASGSKGLISLEKTMAYLNKHYPDVFTIADAKRGDIGNTAMQYAKSFFGNETAYSFDAMTVAPYMGHDSVSPFLTYKDHWVILLALTSNSGAEDFQLQSLHNEEKLYERVIKTATTWASAEQLMFVVGATQANMLSDIRKLIPNYFLLVPGVGAQGGNLREVADAGMTADCGLIVNASRNILYASSGDDFAQAAENEAIKMQQEMEQLLLEKEVI